VASAHSGELLDGKPKPKRQRWGEVKARGGEAKRERKRRKGGSPASPWLGGRNRWLVLLVREKMELRKWVPVL
jgi:hypothetical protein